MRRGPAQISGESEMKRAASLAVASFGAEVVLIGALTAPWVRGDVGQVAQREYTFHEAFGPPVPIHRGIIAIWENGLLNCVPEWFYWFFAILAVLGTIAAVAANDAELARLGAFACFAAAAWCLNWTWYVGPYVRQGHGEVGFGAWTAMVGFVIVGVAAAAMLEERDRSRNVSALSWQQPLTRHW